MTTEKMTMHKALCELKTLSSRIEKQFSQTPFVFANKHANTKVSGVNIEKFCEEIKSGYKSIKDLILRRDAIKRAVTMSNSTTKVMIAGVEYTVAEAIEIKNNGIPLKQGLLNKLEMDNRRARRDADTNNGEALEERALEYIKTMYGNNIDIKNASEEIKKMHRDFITSQTFEIVDPIGIKEEMERLSEEINSFMVEIDSALSVSNATTEITIEY